MPATTWCVLSVGTYWSGNEHLPAPWFVVWVPRSLRSWVHDGVGGVIAVRLTDGRHPPALARELLEPVHVRRRDDVPRVKMKTTLTSAGIVASEPGPPTMVYPSDVISARSESMIKPLGPQLEPPCEFAPGRTSSRGCRRGTGREAP
jgi:hypothetical protein